MINNLQPCRHCATDAFSYHGYCAGCVLRRAARLSPSRCAVVIDGVESSNGPDAAARFRAQVDGERARLARTGSR